MRRSTSTTKDKKNYSINKSANTPPTKIGKTCFENTQARSHIFSLAQNYGSRLKPLIKPTLYVFLICVIANLAIWRTNTPYIDDIHRDYNGGYAFSYAFARHSSSLLMYILNMDFTLQNLSPLTQILAMLFIAITCVMITYILCNRKIKYLPLTLSTLIAINPLALGCWMFQYDAPGMALSILSATFPILYWYKLNDLFSSDTTKKQKHRLAVKFIIISSLSLLVTWTSYQSSSGILPLLVLAALFIDILQSKVTTTSIKKVAFYAVPYIISTGIFLIIYQLSPLDNYRSAEIASLNELLPTIARNLQLYLYTPWKYLNGSWRIMIILLAASFIAATVVVRERAPRRIRNFLLSTSYIALALPVSYGAYILLGSPASNSGESSTFGRTAIGLGFVLSLMCVITAQRIMQNKIAAILAVPGLLLLVSFISYNTAFANAYEDQLEYNKFRAYNAVSDIARFRPDAKELSKQKISVYSYSNEYSGEMEKLIKAHPISKLITTDMEPWLTEDYFSKIPQLDTSVEWRWGSHYKKECGGAELKSSTYYHTIREKSNGDLCVFLK